MTEFNLMSLMFFRLFECTVHNEQQIGINRMKMILPQKHRRLNERILTEIVECSPLWQRIYLWSYNDESKRYASFSTIPPGAQNFPNGKQVNLYTFDYLNGIQFTLFIVHIVEKFFEMRFPKKRVLRNRKIGPRLVSVHRFWSPFRKNSIVDRCFVKSLGQFWVFIIYWNNF